MAKRIALFNHKGGVSKTTTAFHLGWMLAEKGKKVILVDADPQCNLTGMVLGYSGPTELEKFYDDHPEQNIRDGLAPAFESRPKPIQAVECVPVPGRKGLFLLPGHIRIAEYEVTLGIAQELSASISTLKNLPGALSTLLSATADTVGADYVIIDLSPSLSALNQNALLTADYFIVPTAPDFFSLMALDSLSSVLPQWSEWLSKAQKHPVFHAADYKIPTSHPKFLGVIVQKFRPRGGEPSRGFQTWIDQIDRRVTEQLVPALSTANMLLEPKRYRDAKFETGYRLATIADFNSLIAVSQDAQVPVFSLEERHLRQREQRGFVLGTSMEARDQFREVFEGLAKRARRSRWRRGRRVDRVCTELIKLAI